MASARIGMRSANLASCPRADSPAIETGDTHLRTRRGPRLPMRTLTRLFVAIALMSIVGGCVAPASSDWKTQLYEDSVRPRIILQVCVSQTNGNGPELISVSSVRSDSIGGSAVKRAGATEAGQPYFEASSGFPAKSLGIVVAESRDGLRYVFFAPKNLTSGRWSGWTPPAHASESGSDVSFDLLYGREPKKVPLPSSAPRVRFTLMSSVAFGERLVARRENRLNESVPACP